ncbi:MAG TPA: T9SS type A sorting domain-containing protein, partial [Ferruginibacter sp.]|nr:T9SS type A sorting domain-containing protein [Ferruginibacter sp.]
PLIGTPNALAYSIRKVSTAAGYNWTAPAGSTLTHANAPGVNDTLVYLTLDAGFATGLITVQSINDCGASNNRGLTVVRDLPSTPGSISGPANVCSSVILGGQADAAIFGVPLVNDITYNWTVPAGSITNPSFLGPNYIEVYFPENFSDGVVSVTASNGCGTSNARLFNVRAQAAVIPGSITETAAGGDCTARQYTYSISDMPANADSVIWSVPAGGTIVSGQGTTTITVTYTPAAVSGFVTAYASNHCSISANRKYTVSIAACSPFSFAASKSASPLNELVKAGMTASVFPNPSPKQFQVLVNSKQSISVHARLLDGAGRLLQTANILPNQIWQMGQQLPAGLYFLELVQGAERSILRLVKQ